MMSPIEALMRDWLTHPDPLKRSHAAARIALGFDAAPAAVAVAREPFDGAEFRAVRTCPSRFKENCGCAWPYRCRASYGQPATIDDCTRCLRARGAVAVAATPNPGDPP